MRKGIDAPFVPFLFFTVGLVGGIPAWRSQNSFNFIFPALMIIMAIVLLHTSLVGKYKIIHDLVKSLNIPHNSRCLDLGTGHGAVLMEVAKVLEQPGEVVGIDIWHSADQSGNLQATTQQNIDQAELNKVAWLQTASMTKLPFNNDEFDFVFASFAIHNVKPRSQRRLAISEALRVLKKNGQLVIIDMEHIGEFKRALVQDGCKVVVRRCGINGLWGWIPTSIIIAKKEERVL